MKRWLPRFLWFLAWLCWAWLGWGLYRELPRSMTRTLSDLPLRGGERPIGFVGGGDFLLTETSLPGDRSRFVVRDVAGARRRSESVTPSGWQVTRIAPFHAVAFGGPSDDAGRATSAVEAFDLQTGERTRLADGAEIVGVDAARPRVALAFKSSKTVSREQGLLRSNLWVVDFHTGTRILSWADSPTTANDLRIRYAQFDGDDGLYLLADHSSDNGLEPAHCELIRLSLTSGEISRTTFGRGRSHPFPPVRGGRVVQFGGGGSDLVCEVYEVSSGRCIFSSKDHSPADRYRTEWDSPPRLSPDGRSLYTGIGTLWSIDDKRRLWPRSPEEPLGGWSVSGSFVVSENWNHWLDRFFGPKGFATVAVRDFADGSLRYRYRAGIDLAFLSEDGRLGVTEQGTVYFLPPVLNWPLLALCEAVLALPLILLWMTLKLRRRRKLRIAVWHVSHPQKQLEMTTHH